MDNQEPECKCEDCGDPCDAGEDYCTNCDDHYGICISCGDECEKHEEQCHNCQQDINIHESDDIDEDADDIDEDYEKSDWF